MPIAHFSEIKILCKKYSEIKKILHQSDTATKICQKIWKNTERSGKKYEKKSKADFLYFVDNIYFLTDLCVSL
jgi:hypothetical protein